MSDQDEPKEALGATGTDLSVDQLAALVSKLSQTQLTQLLGKVQGAKPKTQSVPQVERKPPIDIEPTGNNDGRIATSGVTEHSSNISDHKLPKLPRFSGSSSKNEPSYRVWRFEIDNLRETFSEREVSRIIHQSVSGNAAEVLMRLGKHVSVVTILNKFEHVFGSVVSEQKLLSDFYTAQQKPTESIADWSCRLEDILSQPSLEPQIVDRDNMLKSRFFYGLHNCNIKNAIRHRFTTVGYEDLLVSAREAEDEGKPDKAISKPQVTSDPLASQLKEIQQQLKEISTKMVEYDRRLGSQKRPDRIKTFNADTTPTTNKREVKCYYCRQPGHTKRECPKLLKGKSPVVGSNQ